MTTRNAIDPIDTMILRELRDNARIPVTTLADRVGRSRTAVQARLNRMEQDGTIRKYSVLTSEGGDERREIGAVVEVHVGIRSQAERLVAKFRKIPEVMSCLSVTGDFAFMLMIARCSPERLTQVVETIYAMRGVTKTNTVIALRVDF